jgi:hypothetical protein
MEAPMNQNSEPSLSLQINLGCPRCHRYNFVKSFDPNIYFYCPDKNCGYIIWATYPNEYFFPIGKVIDSLPNSN